LSVSETHQTIAPVQDAKNGFRYRSTHPTWGRDEQAARVQRFLRVSGRRQNFLQHVLALDEPLPRHVGTPTARNLSQVSNRNIDGRTQVDGEVGFTRDLMVAQPDNLGTQRGTPESPHKNAGARLINR